MWNQECLFIVVFFFIFIKIFLIITRGLEFLIFLEVFSLLLILFILESVSCYDYTLVLKLLILISCERAIGLSLLVVLVRKFRVDQINKKTISKCEGF